MALDSNGRDKSFSYYPFSDCPASPYTPVEPIEDDQRFIHRETTPRPPHASQIAADVLGHVPNLVQREQFDIPLAINCWGNTYGDPIFSPQDSWDQNITIAYQNNPQYTAPKPTWKFHICNSWLNNNSTQIPAQVPQSLGQNFHCPQSCSPIGSLGTRQMHHDNFANSIRAISAEYNKGFNTARLHMQLTLYHLAKDYYSQQSELEHQYKSLLSGVEMSSIIEEESPGFMGVCEGMFGQYKQD